MKSAMIENGIVTNVILGSLPGYVSCGDDVTIGWLHDGQSFAMPSSAPEIITIEKVQQERARRLALGFAYDFGDARSVHQIGTTEADMVGWRDVIDFANALIDTGDTTTIINIVTDTGPASVTAPEWQAVMLQAATVRQLIWAKSFALSSMNPIPADYANDSHWT